MFHPLDGRHWCFPRLLPPSSILWRRDISGRIETSSMLQDNLSAVLVMNKVLLSFYCVHMYRLIIHYLIMGDDKSQVWGNLHCPGGCIL